MGGKIVEFTFAQMLTGLTTGLVLLSSATTIVVLLATNVFKNKDKFLLQIYQFTEDMSNYKMLDHDREYPQSFTGEMLFKAQGSALNNQQITEILGDYEVRLNRLDGRDAKLA